MITKLENDFTSFKVLTKSMNSRLKLYEKLLKLIKKESLRNLSRKFLSSRKTRTMTESEKSSISYSHCSNGSTARKTKNPSQKNLERSQFQSRNSMKKQSNSTITKNTKRLIRNSNTQSCFLRTITDIPSPIYSISV